MYKSNLNRNINDIKIIDWGIIQLIDDDIKCKTVPLETITEILYNKLHDKFINYDIDTILLENQPVLKNPLMKSIQMIIYGYFNYEKHIMGRNIESIKLINASNKLKLGKKLKDFNNSVDVQEINKINSKYTKNKKLAIIYTNHFLKQRLIEEDYEKYNTIFNDHKKKDDLSDAFLQGLYFIEH
tara:strand:+ start:1294 stop:1845 length:552 start_codon:yes stop_codon:yes gene_type:complete